MTQKPADMVRINTRVSKTVNDFLDKRSAETGMSKSALVMLACEMYMQQTIAMDKVSELSKLTQEVELLKKIIASTE